jgi:hypothetical protein
MLSWPATKTKNNRAPSRSSTIFWGAGVCVLLLAPVSPLAGRDAGTALNGQVDWYGQVVRAIGSGPPDFRAVTAPEARRAAEKAAQADAFRNLLAQVEAIRISGDRSVANGMVDPATRDAIEKLLRAPRVTAKRYYSNGGIEIDVEVPLAAIAEAVAAAIPGRPNSPPPLAAKAETGLVIDGTGLAIQPALSPRLLDQAGEVIEVVTSLRTDAPSLGVAAYVRSLADAKKTRWVGSAPLVLRAIKASGSDLVLGKEAARALRDRGLGHLARGAVAIVAPALGPGPNR